MIADLLLPARIWLAAVRIELRAAIQYRSNVVIQIATSMLTILVLYYFWRAVFASRSDVAGLDFSFMLRYVVLSRFVLSVSDVSGVAYRLSDSIRDGSLIVHLTKPYGLLGHLLAISTAGVAWRALWIGLPLVVLGIVLRSAPEPGAMLGLFVPSILLALLANTAIELSLGLAAFWLRRNEGLIHLYAFLRSFLSGALFPLVLLPGFARKVVAYLPFRTALDVPVGYYLGFSPASAILLQVGWCVTLWGTCLLMLRVAQRRYPGFGG